MNNVGFWLSSYTQDKIEPPQIPLCCIKYREEKSSNIVKLKLCLDLNSPVS